MTRSVPVAPGSPVCVLHRSHRPENLTVEFHHVIPVSWQLHTPLAGTSPFPGPDTDGRGMLWDSRGVWLCPTGHRNTHAWIVRMMHAAADASSNDPMVAFKAVKPFHPPGEFQVAFLALTRFMAEAAGALSVGGQAGLLSLVAARQWGEA